MEKTLEELSEEVSELPTQEEIQERIKKFRSDLKALQNMCDVLRNIGIESDLNPANHHYKIGQRVFHNPLDARLFCEHAFFQCGHKIPGALYRG